MCTQQMISRKVLVACLLFQSYLVSELFNDMQTKNMENYPIRISLDKAVHHLKSGKYMYHNNESCKVKAF